MKSIYLFYTAPIALFNATPHGATAPTWGGVSIKNSLNPFPFLKAKPHVLVVWILFKSNEYASLHACGKSNMHTHSTLQQQQERIKRTGAFVVH